MSPADVLADDAMAAFMSGPSGPPFVRGLADRWFAARDRLLANPTFQRLATAFPLTRPIARRRTRELFDLCAGFVYSQVLLACVRLRLFEMLAEGPQTATALAARLALPPESVRCLLDAAASLKLVTRRSGDRYGLGSLGAALLGTRGLTEMIEHHALFYADLADPVALLRGEREATALAGYWAYAGTEDPAALAGDAVADYSALMAASQAFIAEEVLAAFPFGRHRCVLDVGGGEGAFLSAVAQRFPDLRLILFDLPPVAARAQARFEAAGLAGRAQAVGGDFKSGPLPEGADIVTFVRVLHDHDDETVLTLLRAARRALPADGVLLIAEPMSGTRGAEPAGAAYFGFYLFAMGRGRPRTPDELIALIATAGFGGARLVPTRNPLLVRIIAAHANTP